MSDISTNLLCMHVTYGRGSGNVTIRYASGFNGNVIFARNGVMSLAASSLQANAAAAS